MKTVPVTYFSDALCIWAYFSEVRLSELRKSFGAQVHLDERFCSVFGDTARKIPAAWANKGGYSGFNRHLLAAAEQFPEIVVHPDIWITTRPPSSTGAHLFVKAVQLDEAAGGRPSGTAAATLKGFRHAFFAEGRNIAAWEVQCDVAAGADADIARVEALIHDGTAFAALADDYQTAAAMGIQGSPSYVLNDGRQKLYGNIGYRILEANVQELLRVPEPDQASWC